MLMKITAIASQTTQTCRCKKVKVSHNRPRWPKGFWVG